MTDEPHDLIRSTGSRERAKLAALSEERSALDNSAAGQRLLALDNRVKNVETRLDSLRGEGGITVANGVIRGQLTAKDGDREQFLGQKDGVATFWLIPAIQVPIPPST